MRETGDYFLVIFGRELKYKKMQGFLSPSISQECDKCDLLYQNFRVADKHHPFNEESTPPNQLT